MKKHIPALLLLSSTALAALALPDHPVLGKILERFDGRAVPSSCRELSLREFSTIAAQERFESAVVLKDLTKGGCRLDFLAVGGRDYVNRDLELYERILKDPSAAAAVDLHVHPLMNVEYFRAGHPYKGEIMFADKAAIDRAQLPAPLFDALIKLTEQGKIPAFNLSPPSMPDLLFTAGGSPTPVPVRYEVVTAAGLWRYRAPSPEGATEARRHLEDLNVFSFMYEIANSTDPGIPAERRERAKKLFAENMKNPDHRRRYLEAQACSIGLRRPFTKTAVEALLRGDDAEIRAEFAEKLRLAGRWTALMNEIGFEMEFVPFPVRSQPLGSKLL